MYSFTAALNSTRDFLDKYFFWSIFQYILQKRPTLEKNFHPPKELFSEILCAHICSNYFPEKYICTVWVKLNVSSGSKRFSLAYLGKLSLPMSLRAQFPRLTLPWQYEVILPSTAIYFKWLLDDRPSSRDFFSSLEFFSLNKKLSAVTTKNQCKYFLINSRDLRGK